MAGHVIRGSDTFHDLWFVTGAVPYNGGNGSQGLLSKPTSPTSTQSSSDYTNLYNQHTTKYNMLHYSLHFGAIIR